MGTPPALAPGDRVAVIAPSGPVDPAHLARGIAWLRERFSVAPDPRCAARAGYLAGDDASRAAQLLDALRDPSVRAVLCARGGYGATRLLERYGAELRAALARDPKILVGFSDVTALHALWAHVGAPSVHGPMVTAIGADAVSPDERAALLDALEGRPLAPWSGLTVERGGDASGTARGTNLALVAALQGTPHALPLDGAVLFLEDVGERAYRLDRMLTQLRAGGALAGVRAVVLGDFTDCDGADGMAALRERLVDLGIPVVSGAPFGHGARRGVIPLGRAVHVRAEARGAASVRFADVAAGARGL